MKTSRLIWPSLALGALTWAALRHSESQAQPTTPGLPGARPAIEAARFPTLQAALDALPPDGGVVRLPAGTFEITQPLRLTQEDVLLEGCGTATHVKNVNKSGLPALVIQPARF